MAEPFLGEIRLAGFGIIPRGWTQCNGQILSIAQNTALFSLLGTTYGGNGTTTFQLPNLQARIPLHTSTNGAFPLGAVGGETSHTLTLLETAAHTHQAMARNGNGDNASPTGRAWGLQPASVSYATALTSLVTMGPTSIALNGGNQPHANESPYLVVNFIIALQGIFPSRN
jgi:microcystin-dependent protein